MQQFEVPLGMALLAAGDFCVNSKDIIPGQNNAFSILL